MNAPATFHVEELGSTNDRALQLARDGQSTGTAVTATRQSAGRGRLGRTWETPEGSLALSVLHRPGRAIEETASLTPCVAVALVRGLRELGVEARIKWPNDLRIGGRKVSGILCELHEISPAERVVIVGIGLNVMVSEFPAELEELATSLSRHGCDASLETVTETVLTHVRRALVMHDRGADVPDEYEALLEGVGQRVQWTEDGTRREATLVGARLRDGALRVVDEGVEHFITSGELALVGSAERGRATGGLS